MGLDLWFREDVARILASTQETMRATQAATGSNEDYQQGFTDALRAVGVAFGVAAPSLPTPPPISASVQSIEVEYRSGNHRLRPELSGWR